MADAREVVVTGGGTGIGYATAAHFVESGDRVTITGRREEVLRDMASRIGAGYVRFDAAKPEHVRSGLDRLPENVDVLVNNAGGNTNFSSPQAGDDNDLEVVAASWQANLEANLLSAVLVTTGLKPRLSDYARVVSVSSIAAKRGAGSYAAAKAGIEAWNAGLAQELGPRGITANVVSPGLIIDTEFFHGTLSASREETLIGETGTKRAGTPEDVAEAIGFLASPGAGHITGQVVHVNGGAYLGK